MNLIDRSRFETKSWEKKGWENLSNSNEYDPSKFIILVIVHSFIFLYSFVFFARFSALLLPPLENFPQSARRIYAWLKTRWIMVSESWKFRLKTASLKEKFDISLTLPRSQFFVKIIRGVGEVNFAALNFPSPTCFSSLPHRATCLSDGTRGEGKERKKEREIYNLC